ncbi:lytic transglycosylase [Wenzhouxiangella marina]|uniref:Putative membrane-bound lytic murein transglycosylase n=1 Tax=Wenzhouxiangella marina TaxID=1579979 RepID=A0A0K0XWI3_9GAMM|nr:LysM peptidoglycan-binding domain-containing protein [Wenzhouxiangella marina]AKS42030.1 Putative membrane-bound lytic murein transglycosylase [Wenzhouxiangella marina]MBB6086202.1 membrane-bound lytic murein transglycosylase D [Wenzhouxiangella marina]
MLRPSLIFFRIVRSSALALSLALVATGCALHGARPLAEAEPQATAPPVPPYYLRAHLDDPFEQIDRAIRRVGTAVRPTAAEEAEAVDLWQRVVDRFEFAECPADSRAEQWAFWFGERHDYLARVMDRAHPWLHDIASELERRDLPGELALLPIVESAYDPFAYSHGQAAGAWQFVAPTAREYGLEINEFYDGRRDVYAATRAALTYLATLNQRFDGDWNLALAAYNGGQGRVRRAIRRNRNRGRSIEWADLPLPRETLAYVPKLHGLGCLFREPQRYGWERPIWPDRPQVARIELPGPIDVVNLAVEAELDLTEIVALNAGLSRHLTSPTGPHHLIVPQDAAERVHTALPRLNAAELISWQEVEVQRGDTLSELAQRHSTSIRALREANDLDGDFLRAGQRLRLPQAGRQPADSPHAALYQELASLQERLLPTRRFRHVVRPGESLWVIARRYSVGVDEIRRWNGLGSSSLIRPGQRLMIEMDGPASPSRTRSYTVRSGDSLWTIARRHRVSLADLMRWNGLDESSVLRPGQTLTINRGS